jgi:hypothetical protein
MEFCGVVALLLVVGVPFGSVFWLINQSAQARGHTLDPNDVKDWLAARRKIKRPVLRARSAPSPSPEVLRFSSTVLELAAAFAAGEDCHFALADALLEAGHDTLAEAFRTPDHPAAGWTTDMILGIR